MDKSPLTESDIADFLRESLSALSAHHGIKFEAVSINERPEGSLYVSIHAHGECEFGPTLVAAAKSLAAKLGSPANLAAAKRERAAKLLAEAEALSPSTQNGKAPAL